MRTTVSIPDEAYEILRETAHRKRITIGQAIAELVLEEPPKRILGIDTSGSFPKFILPPGPQKKIDADLVYRLLREAEEEEAERKWNPHGPISST